MYPHMHLQQQLFPQASICSSILKTMGLNQYLQFPSNTTELTPVFSLFLFPTARNLALFIFTVPVCNASSPPVFTGMLFSPFLASPLCSQHGCLIPLLALQCPCKAAMPSSLFHPRCPPHPILRFIPHGGSLQQHPHSNNLVLSLRFQYPFPRQVTVIPPQPTDSLSLSQPSMSITVPQVPASCKEGPSPAPTQHPSMEHL